METVNNQKLSSDIQEPVVSVMPGIMQPTPLANKPIGMPGMPLDPGLSNRLQQSKKPARGMKLKLVIPIVLTLLVLAGGAYAWFFAPFGQALWLNYGADFPNWENYQAKANLSLTIHNIEDNNEVSASQDWLGLGTDFSLEGVKLSLIYDNHQSGKQSSGQVKLALAAKDTNFNFNTFFKKIDQDVYVKPELKELVIPALQQPLVLGEDWVSFNVDQVDQWVNEASASDAKKSVEEYLSDSQAKEEEFLNRLVSEKIFIFTDTRENKATPSGNIRKFEYRVAEGKREALVKMLDELWSDGKMTDDEKMFFNKFFEVAKISVWINTKTRFIQEMNVEALNITFRDDLGSRQFDIVFTYEISEAASQTVVAPTPTVKALDFFNTIVSQLMSPETYLDNGDELDMSLDSDQDTLPDELEAIYGTDPQNPDSDNDGYLDGQEIENGYNPLGNGTLENLEM